MRGVAISPITNEHPHPCSLTVTQGSLSQTIHREPEDGGAAAAAAAASAAAAATVAVAVSRDSLWLPYRRDEGVIREAISSALQQGPLKAIFGHADVVSTVS
mgnify:CR=1 FL=1